MLRVPASLIGALRRERRRLCARGPPHRADRRLAGDRGAAAADRLRRRADLARRRASISSSCASSSRATRSTGPACVTIVDAARAEGVRPAADRPHRPRDRGRGDRAAGHGQADHQRRALQAPGRRGDARGVRLPAPVRLGDPGREAPARRLSRGREDAAQPRPVVADRPRRGGRRRDPAGAPDQPPDRQDRARRQPRSRRAISRPGCRACARATRSAIWPGA